MDIKERTVETTIKLLEDNIIEFIAVTEQYVPKDILPNLAAWGEKQPIIYRHEHPAKGWGGQILGRSIKAEVIEFENITALKGKAKLFDNTNMQKMALEYIQKKQDEGNPIQISIGYQEFYKDGKVVDAQIYEYSLTHIPVCEECVVSIGELEMDETKQKELEDKLAKAVSTSDEMKDALDKMSGKTKELETKVASKDAKIKEYEEKYVAQKDEVSKLTTRISELEDNMRFAPLKLKVQAVTDSYGDPELFTYFKTKALEQEKPEEWLDKKLESRKTHAVPAVQTQTIKELEQEVAGETQTTVSLLEKRQAINSDPSLSDSMKRIMIGMLKK